MKVKLHNFQAHHDAEIEIKGLTGVIGSNNSGKTSLIRSVRDFVLNNFGAEKITQGQKSGYIEIDGIRLSRTEKTSMLKMPDGKTFEKMAGQKIAKVVQLKDFLYIDSTKISNCLPQFNFQHETQFPFALSNSQVYQIFSMLFDIERLNKLFLYSKEKIKSNTNQIGYEKGKLDESLKMLLNLEEKKSKLPPIERIERLEYLLKSYTTILQNVTRLQNDKIKTVHYQNLQMNLAWKQYLSMVQLQEKYQAFHFDMSNGVILALLEKQYRLNMLQADQAIKLSRLEDLEKQLGAIKTCPLCGK